jgi:hypothetical protein
MAGQERGKIKAKLKEAKIPDAMIKELLPMEGVAAEGAEGAAPAEGEAAAEGAAPAEEGAAEEKKEEAPAKEKKK